MKIPNHLKLVVALSLVVMPAIRVFAADAAPAAQADADASTPVVASTASNAAVPLPLTPAAMSKNAPVVSINLARWFSGASLILVHPNGVLEQITFDDRDETPWSVLLQDDETAGAEFDSGVTHLMIDLGGQQTVESFGFFSFTASGSVDVSYATGTQALLPTSSDWKPANVHMDFGANQPVHVDIQPLEARLLMITLNLNKEGEIGALSIFGKPNSSKTTVAPKQDNDKDKKNKTVNPEDLVEFDYAKQAFGSRVTHLSGGNVDEAQNVLNSDPKSSVAIGENTTTSGNTTESGNIAPGSSNLTNTDNVMVVDMGQNRNISKVALLFASKGEGKIEFYLLNDLPTQNSAGVDTPAGGSAGVQPTPSATPSAAPAPSSSPTPSTTPGLTPTAAPTPTAMTWPSAHHGETTLLLADMPGSLAEALVMSQIAQQDQTPSTNQTQTAPVDYLPKNFFQTTKPSFTQSVNPSQVRVSMQFQNQSFRYCLIHWIPANPSTPPLQMFKVNLIGKVNISDFIDASKKNSSSVGLPASAAGPVSPTTVATLSNLAANNKSVGGGGGGGGSSTSGGPGTGSNPPGGNPGDPSNPTTTPTNPPPTPGTPALASP
jgi:hypothetical protein